MSHDQQIVTFDECIRVLAYFCISHEVVVTAAGRSVSANGITFGGSYAPNSTNIVPFIRLKGLT